MHAVSTISCSPAKWVVAPAVVDQSHVVVNDCEQNHTNSLFFVDLCTKRIDCRQCLTGEVLVLGYFVQYLKRYRAAIP